MEFQNIKNPLFEKRVVFDGDSICHGSKTGGWAKRIGERNAMQWENCGVCGGTITAEIYVESTGAPRHWITRSIDKIYEKHKELDYLILEGGTNDADLLGIGSARFGEYSLSDYSGSYNDATFTGACESLLYKAISYYPTAKIGFIIAHKMGLHALGYGDENKRRHYFNRASDVCQKWGVPVLDLWNTSPLNPSLPCYYDKTMSVAENTAAGKSYEDGQHLTALGYDLITDRIEAFMRSL